MDDDRLEQGVCARADAGRRGVEVQVEVAGVPVGEEDGRVGIGHGIRARAVVPLLGGEKAGGQDRQDQKQKAFHQL